MRRANKVILTMGSAMLISAGAAMAGPPAPYNDYTANNGTISATCPTGSFDSCGTAITGTGFFQRSVVIAGKTYFQTIVLPNDANVTGAGDIANLAFADENFVQQGGGTGIADNQHLFASGTATNPGDFTADTSINSGWAKTGTNVINLTQSISDSAAAFDLGFTLASDGVSDQANSVAVTQSVKLNTASTSTDKQVFDLRRLLKTDTGTTVALPGSAGTIAWASNDVIQAVWMGQQVTATGTQDSGFQSYSNVTSGTQVSYTDQTATGPWSYDTSAFGGSAPTF